MAQLSGTRARLRASFPCVNYRPLRREPLHVLEEEAKELGQFSINIYTIEFPLIFVSRATVMAHNDKTHIIISN